MAFGFLVEKFDLFVAVAGHPAAGAGPFPGQLVGNVAGLALILLGGITMVVAAIRFRQTALAIDSPDRRKTTSGRIDLALAGLLVLLGATLFVYLIYTIVIRP